MTCLGYMIRQISTHTSLAGRDSHRQGTTGTEKISTHTSLAGRDYLLCHSVFLTSDFYSHVPRGT